MASLSLETERLLIRDWAAEDAEAAFRIYGNPEIAMWLTPVMQRVPDLDAMRAVLDAWVEAAPNLAPPTGRWAMVRRSDNVLVGGLGLRLLPPYEEDLEIRWQVRQDEWGRGYATEGARALLGWAFAQDVDEVFAVARAANSRAIATARNIGMDWVGETTKYHGLHLQVFRLRRADFDGPVPPT
ncbi:RimJ/RimL family protein N-acetyltransferase [Actinopolyspora biskrensis]|uniref:RimJ/RimL family protein N-acetyltransferase n=1 Tax=Actinopolyspora biskrensis TaxID=1470178 RepID=A0A852Z7V6_9ACTN|nr:GNAT family N-acetyltransferase [Actinopolyspora biskrensis]NYH78253.1 RimJ/RimL family protein N-acetyltransferase [Actinopolyspora biskrensis]